MAILSYDLSDKNTTMVYTSVVSGPIVISGFGKDDILEIEAPEIADSDVGADGTRFSWIKPSVVKGQINLIGTSAAMVGLTNMMNTLYELGTTNPGSLIVTGGALWSFSYTNVVWTTGFGGFNLKQHVQDYKWKFVADLPDSTQLSSLISIASGIGGLI
jgi:hypothetical protein